MLAQKVRKFSLSSHKRLGIKDRSQWYEQRGQDLHKRHIHHHHHHPSGVAMSSSSMSSSPSILKGNSSMSLLSNYHRQQRVSTPISHHRQKHNNHHPTNNHNIYNLPGGSPHGGSLDGGSTHITKSPHGTNTISFASDKFLASNAAIPSTSSKWPKVPSLEGVLRALAGVREDFVETLLLPQMSHKIGEFT